MGRVTFFKTSRGVVWGAWLTLLVSAMTLTQAGVIEAEGLLMPNQQARLASRAQGVISSICQEGDEVKARQSVMQLETSMEELQVRQQERIRALRRIQSESAEELGRKDAISENERQEKQINLEVADVQLEQAQELQERHCVRAPFDGVISERLREKGEAVDEFVPVLMLVEIKQLALEIYLPAKNLGQIQIGQKAKIRLTDLPDRVFEGSVTKMNPVINPASGEFKVKILVPNDDGKLAAGMRASAEIDTGEGAPPQPDPQ